MRCPACEEADTKVVDSRSSDDGESIRRRRECLRCGHRFTTYERLGERPVIVIKSDGSAEAFDQEKLMRGVLIACAKRPVTPDQIERLVASIEAELRALPKGEVRSWATWRSLAWLASTTWPTSASRACTRTSRTSRSSPAR